MGMPFKIGVLQLSMEPLDETVRMAQACDAAGFDTFWLAEAYPWWRKHSMEARSSTAVTAIVARETKKIAIGWGIISPYTRHPVQIAMEARVLQEAAGKDRFLLGLGASKIFMKEIGEGEKGKEVGPAIVMRESIEIIEAMLAGGEVKYEGKAFQAYAPALKADARVPRWRPPIYVGATGPVLQRLAGSHSDGLLTASITTPRFVRYSRNMMEEGARKAGKDTSELDLGSVIVGSVGEDPRSAREGAREMAAMYLAPYCGDTGTMHRAFGGVSRRRVYAYPVGALGRRPARTSALVRRKSVATLRQEVTAPSLEAPLMPSWISRPASLCKIRPDSSAPRSFRFRTPRCRRVSDRAISDRR